LQRKKSDPETITTTRTSSLQIQGRSMQVEEEKEGARKDRWKDLTLYRGEIVCMQALQSESALIAASPAPYSNGL
jgi:hypothetical protein